MVVVAGTALKLDLFLRLNHPRSFLHWFCFEGVEILFVAGGALEGHLVLVLGGFVSLEFGDVYLMVLAVVGGLALEF